jgi:hypothetical protein
LPLAMPGRNKLVALQTLAGRSAMFQNDLLPAVKG